jgi:hypothetical protein
VSTDRFVNKMLKVNQTEALNERFDQLGFKSMRFINNMGILMIPIAAYILGLVVLNITDRISCNSSSVNTRPQASCVQYAVRSFSSGLKKLLVHNFIIGMLMQFYIVIALSSFISLHDLQFRPFGESVESLVSLAMLAAIVLLPVGLTIYSFRGETTESSISAFYTGLRLD